MPQVTFYFDLGSPYACLARNAFQRGEDLFWGDDRLEDAAAQDRIAG
jgi:2-hydroxychromene-2-carboxylate isomerase